MSLGGVVLFEVHLNNVYRSYRMAFITILYMECEPIKCHKKIRTKCHTIIVSTIAFPASQGISNSVFLFLRMSTTTAHTHTKENSVKLMVHCSPCCLSCIFLKIKILFLFHFFAGRKYWMEVVYATKGSVDNSYI